MDEWKTAGFVPDSDDDDLDLLPDSGPRVVQPTADDGREEHEDAFDSEPDELSLPPPSSRLNGSQHVISDNPSRPRHGSTSATSAIFSSSPARKHEHSQPRCPSLQVLVPPRNEHDLSSDIIQSPLPRASSSQASISRPDFETSEAQQSPPDSPLSSLSSSSGKWPDTFELPPLEEERDSGSILNSIQLQQYYGNRSLRQRNPIQLHPYMLEAERYKRSMHSRGIKPVAVPRDAEGSNNQEQTAPGEEDDTQIFQPSSPPSSVYSEPETQQDHLPADQDSQMQDLVGLQRTDDQARRISHLSRPRKKRKLDEHASKLLSRALDKSRKQPSGHGKDKSVSPHRVHSKSPARVAAKRVILPNGFRLPPTVPMTSRSDQQHETEAQRSDAETQRLSDVSDGTLSDSSDVVRSAKPRRRKAVISMSSDDDSDQPLSPLDIQVNQAALFKKRIKGVLPASWTTLNLQAGQASGAKQSDQPQQHRHSTAQDQHRGVAKPIKIRNITSTSASKLSEPVIHVFSDDEEDSQPAPVSHPRPESRSDIGMLAPDDAYPDSDDMEDNAVDMMLGGTSTRHRKQPSATSSRSKQKQLKQSRISSHMTQKKRTRQPSSVKKPRRKGVLENNQSFKDLPNFLRVAARTARRQPNRGRSSPSRKAFRFHNAEDHAEVNAFIKEWQDDVSDSDDEATSTAVHRSPLLSVPGNGQRRPISRNIQATLDSWQATTNDDETEARHQDPRQQDQVRDKATKANHPNLQRSRPHAQPQPRKGRTSQNSQKRQKKDRSAAAMALRLEEASYQQNVANIAAQMESTAAKRAPNRPAQNARTIAGLVNSFPEGPAQLSTATDTSDKIWRPRFAPERVRQPEAVPIVPGPADPELVQQAQEKSPEVLRRKIQRKRVPQRHQPLVSDWQEAVEEVSINRLGDAESLVAETPLRGLESSSLPLNLDFGIQPLHTGHYFDKNSFVGSGQFAICLGVTSESEHDFSEVDQGWSSTFWNETVRSELAQKLERIKSSLHVENRDERQVTQIRTEALESLESMSKYLRFTMGFTDRVDRNDFLQTCVLGVQDVSDRIQDELQVLGDPSRESSDSSDHLIHASSRLALLMHQLNNISMDDAVTRETRSMCRQAFSGILRDLANLYLSSGIDRLRAFLRLREDVSSVAAFTSTATSVAESFVIFAHIVRQEATELGTIWNHFDKSEAASRDPMQLDPLRVNVGDLERRWRNICTVLPLLDLDVSGVKYFTSAALRDSSDWITIKKLLKPIFDGYQLGVTDRLPSFNRYCRVLFRRCFQLISQWGWQKCDSIVGFLFDFFARNRLANLKREYVHGSSAFLEDITDETKLGIQDSDTCFQTFLKIIGTSLQTMREYAPEKKVKDLVWRLIPNHDRRHPKDKEIRQEDLDATRNHHDLLCTLYWAAPASHRPSLKLIRSLVEDENSHREAYGINLRAWLNLVRYQIKSDSSQANLEPFNDWISNLLERLLRQYALARTDIETQVRQSELVDGLKVDQRMQDRAIESNQKQVQYIIQELLISMRNAVSLCPTAETANALVPKSIARVFQMRDGKRSRIDKTIIEALSVIRAIVSIKTQGSEGRLQADEDSQGFDWGAFDELEDPASTPNDAAKMTPLEIPVYEALHSLILACFGEATVRSDELLTVLVQTWSEVAARYVRDGHKSWDSYLGPYGHDTWMVISDSTHRRKFTPLLCTLILKADAHAFEQHVQVFMGIWLTSLVDRESQFKYQGELTAQLLNTARDEPLLTNLPFAMDMAGKYSVSNQDMLQRRISVLATVLSNMRRAVSPEFCSLLSVRQERLSDYRGHLELLMSAMRQRFEELGSDEQTQNAYVAFVHSVVSLLQEHVQEICPVDPFFTDSAAFPLPPGDSTYITSKLRAYGLRLNDQKTHKQLAIFIIANTERAVFDGQQAEMAGYLAEAAGMTSPGNDSQCLADFLLRTLLPAFAQGSIESSCGRLMLLPILRGAQKVLECTLPGIDSCNEKIVNRTITTIETVLSVSTRLMIAILSEGVFDLPLARVAVATIMMVTEILPIVDYFYQLNHINKNHVISQQIGQFSQMCCEATDQIESSGAVKSRISEARHTSIGRANPGRSGLEDFVSREVKRSLQRFRFDGTNYQAIRGQTWKTVAKRSMEDAQSVEEEMRDANRRFEARVNRLDCIKAVVEHAEASREYA